MTARTTAEIDGTFTRHVRLSAVFTFGALFPLFLFGANSVEIQSELGFGTRELGYAGAAFFAAGAAAAMRTGVLIDRIGTKAALRIGMLFSLFASMVIAFLASSWWLVAIGTAACGLAHAFTQLALNRMLVVGQHRSAGALSFGLKQAAVPVVSLAAGFSTALVVPGLSWRFLYVVGSLFTLLLVFLAPTTAGDSGHYRLPAGVRSPGLRRLAIGAALAASAGNSLSLLIVDSFDANNFSASWGAIALGIGSGLATLSRVGGGWLVERRRSDGARELRLMLMAGAGGFIALAMSSSSLPALLMGASIAFMAGWGWQGLVFYMASQERSIPPATATGVVLSGTMGGSVVGPIVVSAVAESYGYSLAWIVAASALVLGAATVPSINSDPSRRFASQQGEG